MRIVLALALLLVFAPVAFAQQADPPAPVAQSEVEVQKAATPDLQTDAAQAAKAPATQQQAAQNSEAATAAQPARGSWLWIVSAVVVGGLVLWALGFIG